MTTHDNTQTVSTGSTWPPVDGTTFTALLTLRMTCTVGQHEYQQGRETNLRESLGTLLFCAKCGDVIKFELEDDE